MHLSRRIIPMLLVMAVTGFGWQALQAQTPAQRLLADKFDEVQKVIKPHPGESRWMQIDWLTSLYEARLRAAAEGKPIFVWNGSGGAPMCHT